MDYTFKSAKPQKFSPSKVLLFTAQSLYSYRTDNSFVCDPLTGGGGGQAGNGGRKDEGLLEDQWLWRRIQ